MGEAKRRAQARMDGRPFQPPRVCPVCRSTRIRTRTMPPGLALTHVATPVDVCLDCEAFWEAYPADWCEDVVGAQPCDNCAFRPGSPEIADREAWAKLLGQLKAGQVFNCHKGAPIRIDPVTREVAFDADWIREHGRICAGFHRAIMTQPGWLERRYGALAAPVDPEAPSEGE